MVSANAADSELSSFTPGVGLEPPALSARLCLGFGVGTVGVSIMASTLAVYFPTFMATVLGQSPRCGRQSCNGLETL